MRRPKSKKEIDEKRRKALEAIEQLSLHSPKWSDAILQYIQCLESR